MPVDVILPSLAAEVAGLSTFLKVSIPERPDELAGFADAVRGLRRQRPAKPEGAERVRDLAYLGGLGEQRWRFATTTPVLIELRGHATKVPADPQALAVAATLDAFLGLPLGRGRDLGSVDLLLGDSLFRLLLTNTARQEESPLARSIVAAEERSDGSTAVHGSAVAASLAYVRSPDPLTLLIRRAIGLPDDASER